MSDLKHEVIAERWAALIKERMDSGMTIKEWCRERNVRESQYYYWLKTLRRDEADAAEQDPGAAPHKRELNENYTKGEYFRKFIK